MQMPEDYLAARAALLERQRSRLATLLSCVAESNPFYRRKLSADLGTVSTSSLSTSVFSSVFTTKQELCQDQAEHPPYGSNLTFAPEVYTRIHQTSGTTGEPLRWLDTADSWQWWLDCWQEIYRLAGVGAKDRVFFAFSFGPFIGFWAAFEAAQQLGALCIPGGGLATDQRLRAIEQHAVTVLVCTPTYALRLAQRAADMQIDLASGSVQRTIHAGEPGASVPAIAARIEAAWGASCYDHVGATELGAWGGSCGIDDHVHILEEQFVAEIIDSNGRILTAADASNEGRQGELVLTNLGRLGSPVIRYRTGDLVDLRVDPCACGRAEAYAKGGVLGRKDDMVVVRGVNIFPSALEGMVREFAEIEEFQVQVCKQREMADLHFEIEVRGTSGKQVAEALARLIQQRIQVKPTVELVPRGSLPRYEMKSRRFRYIDSDFQS